MAETKTYMRKSDLFRLTLTAKEYADLGNKSDYQLFDAYTKEQLAPHNAALADYDKAQEKPVSERKAPASERKASDAPRKRVRVAAARPAAVAAVAPVADTPADAPKVD